MKYHFVWDDDFLGNYTFELSEIEKTIVVATIVGGHNAIFSGYHTERLVKAIKLLRNADIPFVSVEKPIDDTRSLIGDYSSDGIKQGFVTDADKGFLHFSNISSQNCGITSWLVTVMENGWIRLCHNNVVQLPANFQLIAEASYLDCNNQDIKHIVDCCDIRYNCPKAEFRTLYSVETLKRHIFNAKRQQQLAGRTVNNCKITNINDIDPSSVATEKVRIEHTSLETARLGRTMADIFGHIRTFASDLNVAEDCRNICM